MIAGKKCTVHEDFSSWMIYHHRAECFLHSITPVKDRTGASGNSIYSRTSPDEKSLVVGLRHTTALQPTELWLALTCSVPDMFNDKSVFLGAQFYRWGLRVHRSHGFNLKAKLSAAVTSLDYRHYKVTWYLLRKVTCWITLAEMPSWLSLNRGIYLIVSSTK